MHRLAAFIAQLFSFLATLGFVLIFTRPGSDIRAWATTVLNAILVEALFFGMKERLFVPGVLNRLVGVIGVAADGIINTGGVMGIALGILTFGPVAFILGVAEIDLSAPDSALLASLGISALLGLVLSFLPHVLWRDWKPRTEQRKRA